MPSLAAARAANAAYEFSYRPIAVFVGGTSGVGQATAETLAKITHGNAHIFIIGRNRTAAEATLALFPKPASGTSDSMHEFIECDVTMMKNVERTTQLLLARIPRLNFLVLSTGILSFEGRTETEEGIDRRLALNYYSRWKFVHDLLPLLQKAKDEGQMASVMTILGPQGAGKIDLEDLGLKKHFSLLNFGTASATYNNLMLEAFADRSPKVSYIHVWPGIVRTPLLDIFSHWALKPANWLLRGLTRPFSISPEECSQYMLWTLLNSESGVHLKGDKGGDLEPSTRYSGNLTEARTKLWEHTMDEVDGAIRRGRS